MDSASVRKYYNEPGVVSEYSQAANSVGLWASEEIVCERFFKKDEPLLEIGCGAGRIAIGLWEIGYEKLTAIDFAKEMVVEAQRINKSLEYGIDFRVGDATALKYEDEQFAGAIFGFNGLMQIPKREMRKQAMAEALRILKPEAYFIFTTHYRDNPKFKKYWKQEKKRWNAGVQDQSLDEFGDIYRETEHGVHFIHSPDLQEIETDLKEVGFKIIAQQPRSSIANEPLRVREFSDECRFWVAQKTRA